MATFTFETMTPTQAWHYDGQVDSLVFTNPTTTGATLRATFTVATPTSQANLTLLDLSDHILQVFNLSLAPLQPAVMPDGSVFALSGPGGAELSGGALGDGLFGLAGADTLHGGGGNDVIQGGQGADVLEGGAGSDLFLIAPGDSPTVAGQMDTIIDWSSADRLSFPFHNGELPTPSANASNYVETTAGSFSAALATANAQIGGGVVEYVSVQVGGDVIVFADTNGDHGVAEDAVILQGRTLADIAAANIISGTTAPHAIVGLPNSAPPPPPPAAASETLNGGPGADILSGGPENDLIFGRGGADTLSGGGGADTIVIGAGESPRSAAIGNHTENLVHITDWTNLDRLVFAGEPAGSGSNTIGIQANDFDAALSDAQNLFAQRTGTTYILAEVGGDVIVFDDKQDAVVLAHTTYFDGVGPTNFLSDSVLAPPVTTPPVSPPPLASPPPPPVSPPLVSPPPPVDQGVPPSTVSLVPSLAAPGVDGTIFGNMDHVHLSSLVGTSINEATPSHLSLGGGDVSLTLEGLGFTYDGNEQLTGGFAQTIFVTLPIPGAHDLQAILHLDHSLSAAPFGGWVATDATQLAFATILAGADTLEGSDFLPGDLIRGYGGNDLIYGDGGGDTIMGGDGDDTIYALTPPSILGNTSEVFPSYLRGEAGDDSITGAEAFDDINGNMGNDTVHGAGGDDFSVGGKDNDLLFGDDGNDIVWGNLGNDTCDGGAGDDQCRGGQGDDSVTGGAGDDFVSGDRGNDTITGGAGADLFHGSQDAGIDKVLDFHLSEGDRVMLDPGAHFTVSQVGADTVIDMGASSNGAPNQMILVGVQMSTLTGDWIFGF